MNNSLLKGIINPRRACAARVTPMCVCVCVCVSVNRHLTHGASVRPENAVTYSAGNESQNICGVFSETAPLQRSSTPSVVRPCVQSAIFPAEITHAHYSIDRVRFLDISITRALSTTLVALYLKT